MTMCAPDPEPYEESPEPTWDQQMTSVIERLCELKFGLHSKDPVRMAIDDLKELWEARGTIISGTVIDIPW